MAMPHLQTWTTVDVVLMCVMWMVMMVAMMVPSAAPMILMYATMHRRHQEQHTPFVPTSVFLLGYLLIWTGFSVLASGLQWGLHSAALLSSSMGHTGPRLGGILLLAAGVFQWTPLKAVCLTQCRSPLGFFMTNWRDGTLGALSMGLRHGSYCLGCCWVLMMLLFAAGVMNLLWVALIAAFILVEKVVPHGELVGRVAGAGLMVAGLVLLSQTWH
jgi:predicted metal-binding membrane protein